MKTATTISGLLLATGALTLCLVQGAKIVYAESNGTEKQRTAVEARHDTNLAKAKLNQLRAVIAKGDQEGVNREMSGLFEFLIEPPMAAPETQPGSPGFSGSGSRGLNEETLRSIEIQNEHAALSF